MRRKFKLNISDIGIHIEYYYPSDNRLIILKKIIINSKEFTVDNIDDSMHDRILSNFPEFHPILFIMSHGSLGGTLYKSENKSTIQKKIYSKILSSTILDFCNLQKINFKKDINYIFVSSCYGGNKYDRGYDRTDKEIEEERSMSNNLISLTDHLAFELKDKIILSPTGKMDLISLSFSNPEKSDDPLFSERGITLSQFINSNINSKFYHKSSDLIGEYPELTFILFNFYDNYHNRHIKFFGEISTGALFNISKLFTLLLTFRFIYKTFNNRFTELEYIDNILIMSSCSTYLLSKYPYLFESIFKSKHLNEMKEKQFETFIDNKDELLDSKNINKFISKKNINRPLDKLRIGNKSVDSNRRNKNKMRIG